MTDRASLKLLGLLWWLSAGIGIAIGASSGLVLLITGLGGAAYIASFFADSAA
jgi:hypothetical protein